MTLALLSRLLSHLSGDHHRIQTGGDLGAGRLGTHAQVMIMVRFRVLIVVAHQRQTILLVETTHAHTHHAHQQQSDSIDQKSSTKWLPSNP
jgi:hypothetical protein